MFELSSPWHWVTLGLILFGLEVFGAGGFLLGIASSAMVVGLSAWLFEGFGWRGQLVLFAVLSLVYSWVYLQFFRKKGGAGDDVSLINNQAAQLVDTEVDASVAVGIGRSKIAIGDTLWTVRSEVEIAQGEKVRVIGAEGMELVIEPASASREAHS